MPEARPSGSMSVDDLVIARIEPLKQEMRTLGDRVIGLSAENQVLKGENLRMKEAFRRLKRPDGGTSAKKGPDFEGGTEEERDAKRVDWVRSRLEKMERKGRGLSRLEQRRFLLTIETIEDEGLKETIYSEMALRQEWRTLLFQWEKASGSDAAIAKMLGQSNLLTIDQLIEMSDLAEANDGEERERVSLSVQTSRAMNLYLNYLGVWAEALDDFIVKGKPTRPESEIRLHAKNVCKEAQKRLAGLSGNDGGIPFLEENGVKASHLKKILTTLPEKDLQGYGAKFIARVNGANDNELIGLDEIFEVSIFTGPIPKTESITSKKESITAQDILWTKFMVVGLSGSISSETLALWLLDFTGETDVLNSIWGHGYRETDFQKLLRMNERRRNEAKKKYPHGPEANMDKYPEESGRGWFENAKMNAEKIYGLELKNKNGDPQSLSVKEILRGGEWWEEKQAEKKVAIWRSLYDIETRQDWEKKGRRLLEACDPVPFHKMDWNLLSRDTYTLDFLLPNYRYETVFVNCTTKELDLDKNFGEEGLEAMNKALSTAFPKESEQRKEGTLSPDKNPWVWYAIGYLSMHNPERKILLPGMTTPPPENDLLVYELSSDEKRMRAKKPTYNENFRTPLLASEFLTPEEMEFVESYCKVSKKIPIIGRL